MRSHMGKRVFSSKKKKKSFTLPWTERVPTKKNKPCSKVETLKLSWNLQLSTWTSQMPSGGKSYGQTQQLADTLQ